MKAFCKRTYGGPEVLHLEDLPRPEIKANQVLVRVHANSANPADWHILRGAPFFARFEFGLFKPKDPVLGADFAGEIVEVGDEVNDFTIGDRIFGESLQGGAFAEFVAIESKACAKIPNACNYLEMAALPIAGLTAYQGLVTHGKIQVGEKVLINGSSGGVGHFAVQIAKIAGAHVTAVCSSKNEAFVKSLGADEVIAYDKTNIHLHKNKYDLLVDTNGNLHYGDFKRMSQRGVLIGFTTFGNMAGVLIQRAFGKYPLAQFTASANTKDLEILAQWVAEVKIKPHLEKTYPFEEIPEAIGYIEAMRTRGKVVMTGIR